ncbi:hypothetical protein LIER_20533 [Lithospermum erythrorhizon]|uniref:Uncharacterized protein n=1 Tax=Lithospermum erythrorhizon TaxID=34254 RepID=A0AAV3QPY4_LITER
MSIKAHALANFMVEFTHGPNGEAPELVNLMEAAEQYVDGVSNLGSSGAEYGTIPDSTLVEWVAEKAFQTKEVMANPPEGEGRAPGPW